MVTWTAAILLWHRLHDLAIAVSIFLLGLSLGPCLAVYGVLPRPRRQRARRWVLVTGGLSIAAMSLLAAVELDLEGFFMLIFAGAAGVAIGHTIITVIAGPMLFGRFLCGWGCWRAMVLELLPIGRGQGRREGGWCLLPYIGLAACVAGSAAAVALGHRPAGAFPDIHGASVLPVAALMGLYYAAAVSMALVLRDQRAFCKYLCPSGTILRWTSRTSLARISADSGLCNDCGACARVCPMDIDVPKFVRSGARVDPSECILCQRCAHACPTESLRLTIGFGARRQA